MKKSIILILLIVLVVIINNSYFNQDKYITEVQKKIELLENNKDFLIGTIEGTSYITGGNFISSLHFKITINGIDYHCSQGRTETNCLSPNLSDNNFKTNKPFKEGENFLVLVNMNEPKESLMYLDKPIKNSSDFNNYLKELK
ncbi:MAG: hypothetical protein GZ091_12455 [Paludibacter sp.]|nr:hypothetical protein [Paludibacter sp.]